MKLQQYCDCYKKVWVYHEVNFFFYLSLSESTHLLKRNIQSINEIKNLLFFFYYQNREQATGRYGAYFNQAVISSYRLGSVQKYFGGVCWTIENIWRRILLTPLLQTAKFFWTPLNMSKNFFDPLPHCKCIISVSFLDNEKKSVVLRLYWLFFFLVTATLMKNCFAK